LPASKASRKPTPRPLIPFVPLTLSENPPQTPSKDAQRTLRETSPQGPWGQSRRGQAVRVVAVRWTRRRVGGGPRGRGGPRQLYQVGQRGASGMAPPPSPCGLRVWGPCFLPSHVPPAPQFRITLVVRSENARSQPSMKKTRSLDAFVSEDSCQPGVILMKGERASRRRGRTACGAPPSSASAPGFHAHTSHHSS